MNFSFSFSMRGRHFARSAYSLQEDYGSTLSRRKVVNPFPSIFTALDLVVLSAFALVLISLISRKDEAPNPLSPGARPNVRYRRLRSVHRVQAF